MYVCISISIYHSVSLTALPSIVLYSCPVWSNHKSRRYRKVVRRVDGVRDGRGEPRKLAGARQRERLGLKHHLHTRNREKH